MQQVYEDLARDRDLMQRASRELKDRGIALARAEAEYQTAKNKRALEMKAEGYAATMISLILKGDDEVSVKLFERDCAQVLYDSAKEALQCYKLDARLLESQLEREWNDAKRM